MVGEKRTLVVEVSEAGTRLDRWLASRDAALGRRRAKDLCDAGCVWVDGRRAGKSLPLAAGATVCFPSSTPREAAPNSDLYLDIRYESEHCAVVHKIAGQPTAPLDGLERGTLANAVLANFPALRGVGTNPLEPGLIHRLDNGTSGLLILAKTQPAFEVLKRALALGEIEKEYVAVVHDRGLPDTGIIDTPLAPSPHNARRVVVARLGSRHSRPAGTAFTVTARHGDLAMVSVEAKRALRHQIRAHFASIGCPLVNDEPYGGERVTRLAPGRHALHARRVAWVGNPPILGFDVTSPLPEDLRSWVCEIGFANPLA